MSTLTFNSDLTYCPQNLTVSQPLEIFNPTQDEYVFKIKTNHKNLVSMSINHGFIKPQTSVSIPIKIVQKFDEKTTTIKLQINWCLPTEQMKANNDSKMNSVSKEQIKKKIFPIKPTSLNQQKNQSLNKKFLEDNSTDAMFQSVYSARSEQKTKTIKIYQQKPVDVSNPVQVQRDFTKTDTIGEIKTQPKQEIFDSSLKTSISPSKNLEIVSQQDEQDHEKQLQSLKVEQLQERRTLDQIKVKIRRWQQVRSQKQVINSKLLIALVVVSYLSGSLIKNLIF